MESPDAPGNSFPISKRALEESDNSETYEELRTRFYKNVETQESTCHQIRNTVELFMRLKQSGMDTSDLRASYIDLVQTSNAMIAEQNRIVTLITDINDKMEPKKKKRP
jgi:hypothetical protein